MKAGPTKSVQVVNIKRLALEFSHSNRLHIVTNIIIDTTISYVYSKIKPDISVSNYALFS